MPRRRVSSPALRAEPDRAGARLSPPARVRRTEFGLEELRAKRRILARVVVLHGEAALPLFERLDAECRARESHDGLMNRVRQLAAGAEA